MNALFRNRLTPRLLLFCLAVFLKVAASAFSGIGFVLKSAAFMVIGTFVWLVFFAVLLIIAMPAADRFLQGQIRWLKAAGMSVIILLLLAGIAQSTLISIVGLRSIQENNPDSRWGSLFGSLDNAFGYNDSTVLTHQAAINLLDGKNPYAEANIVKAGIQFRTPSDKLTPLRVGSLADAFPYPDAAMIRELWQRALQHPENVPPELESKFSYPAGDFLLPAPFFRLGIDDLRIIYIIILIPALIYTLLKIPKGYRLFFLIVLLASLEIWNALAAGETGLIYFPFILLAWILYRRNLLVSAIFMAAAVAIKQLPWFILPFYFIVIFRTMGLKKLLIAAGVIVVVFFAANAPFIIADHRLWIDSVLAPLRDPMFPIGVGVVSIVIGQVVNIHSPLLFTLIEAAVGAAAVIWYFLNCRRYPDSGPVLAVLPLFFAWRSLWGYFFYVDIMIMASILIHEYGKPAEAIPAVIPKVSKEKPESG